MTKSTGMSLLISVEQLKAWSRFTYFGFEGFRKENINTMVAKEVPQR